MQTGYPHNNQHHALPLHIPTFGRFLMSQILPLPLRPRPLGFWLELILGVFYFVTTSRLANVFQRSHPIVLVNDLEKSFIINLLTFQ